VWGPDAKEFKPERWLESAEGIEEGLPESARMIQGYHHLFTFSDGPRLCLGRNFAVANFKVRIFRACSMYAVSFISELTFSSYLTGDALCLD
jgi:cytochrome P450